MSRKEFALPVWIASLTLLATIISVRADQAIQADQDCPAAISPQSLTQDQVQAALSTSNSSDLFLQEQNYYQMAQSQLLSDAYLLYSSTPQIVYAEFNVDHTSFDLGFGLHIVKRLDVGDKTIFVNEAWPYLRGKLQLPTEIRIRTRTFYQPGDPRGIYHGEDQYLMGRYRIGWDQQSGAHFFEETGWLNGTDRAQRRIAVNIFNCSSCHLSGNPFAAKFRKSENDPINHEAILQPSYFDLSVQENRGYQELFKYLKQQNIPQSQIDSLKASMDKPEESFHSKNFKIWMTSAICAKLSSNAFDWLPQDREFTGDFSALQPSARQDGIYGERNLFWRDSVDQILEDRFGKYTHWIDNKGAVPSDSVH